MDSTSLSKHPVMSSSQGQTGTVDPARLQPILSVKRKLWRKDDEHAALAAESFASVRNAVFQRDNFCCHYCGFKAAKYQEIHNVDGNHLNNEESNLWTVCNLCHMVSHLGMCGMRNAGFIAAIPELTQTEVNHLVRAIHVASVNADPEIKDQLISLYALFQFRGSDTLKQLFGIDISNPYTLAEVLSTCPDSVFENRATLLAPLRLIPTRDAFSLHQLEYYAIHLRSLFLPENWKPLADRLLGQSL